MRSVLVDSSVLLDVATVDPAWAAWSEATLQALLSAAGLVINPLNYAEVFVRYATLEKVDELLPPSLFRREALPYEGGFLAAKCFLCVSEAGRRAHLADAGLLHRRPRSGPRLPAADP